MPYYTGSVNSFTELQNALVQACTANGWTWLNTVLSKGNAFIKPTVQTASPAAGLVIEGGTGQSGSALTGASVVAPRLGLPREGIATWTAIAWPATYHIHINTSPDEIYLVLNANVQDFYWLAFGVSTVPLNGTGLWIAGNAIKTAISAIHIGESSSTDDASYTSHGIFWGNNRSTGATANYSAVQSDAGSVWPLPISTSVPGCAANAPLINRVANNWNGAAVLLPIREYRRIDSARSKLLADLAHARYVRIGNLEPGQILTLGPDRWRVYPFFRKNAAVPNGGTSVNHTGTFGWALRYDGA